AQLRSEHDRGSTGYGAGHCHRRPGSGGAHPFITTYCASARAAAMSAESPLSGIRIEMNTTAIKRTHPDELIVGLVSVSDRATSGAYEDKGIPSLQTWLGRALQSPFQTCARLIADEQRTISETLIELVDQQGCDLVLTTGGTGPARRDVTPEATLAVASKQMPGFGEQMRQISLAFVPTAILSRQVAVIREAEAHAALI